MSGSDASGKWLPGADAQVMMRQVSRNTLFFLATGVRWARTRTRSTTTSSQSHAVLLSMISATRKYLIPSPLLCLSHCWDRAVYMSPFYVFRSCLLVFACSGAVAPVLSVSSAGLLLADCATALHALLLVLILFHFVDGSGLLVIFLMP